MVHEGRAVLAVVEDHHPRCAVRDAAAEALRKLGEHAAPYAPKMAELLAHEDADVREAVIEALQECGALLKQDPYNHKYPYDWRTKKPVITRATSQWFASVESFRADAVSAIDDVEWVPATGKKRLSPMVSGRSDWCISRQLWWGHRIPAWFAFRKGETRRPAVLRCLHAIDATRVHQTRS